MNEFQLKRLEKNLTKSAKKAQKYWVRGMVGFTESDQGFFPIEGIPVTNPMKHKETTLKELFEDVGLLYEDHRELTEKHISLKKEFEDYKLAQESVQNKNVERMEALAAKIAELEAFKID